jgi:hypothetical protein
LLNKKVKVPLEQNEHPYAAKHIILAAWKESLP